jgi:cellulose synthase (UDP-forming)
MTAELLLPWLALLWPLWLSRRPEASRPLWMRRSLLLLLSLFSLRYLHWRVSASLNLTTPLAASLSVLLLLAEGWLLLSGLLPLLLAWRRFSDGRVEADGAQARWQASSWRPWVDVLIPTCGEPLPVLERCLLGCSSLHYQQRTLWVLDDVGRPEVAALAAAYGCRYHHRPQRLHAKAGNLNAGLALGQGELVAVFDADFVPQQHFLERTIGLLLEPQVALVQTPQHCFNADPVMRNLGLEAWLLPDEESFYRWIEPVRSAWGAVVCAGTSFVVRRSALNQIGGFVEQAVSEDLVTGMVLAARGWQLRYLGEKLSAGLAAESMLDFVRQRQRWAAGTLQALRLRQGPLRLRGLGWGQRLAYLEGALHWFNTVPRLLLLLMPLSIGLLGVTPIQLSDGAVLGLLLPLWAALLLSTGWLNRGSRHALLADLPGWSLAAPLAATVLASLWGRIQPFRITPKHRSQSRGDIAATLALPLVALLLLNGLNLVLVARLLLQEAGGAGAVGVLWAALTQLGLLVALRACWDPPQADPTPWLALELPAVLQPRSAAADSWGAAVQLYALSETGAELWAGGDWPERDWPANAGPLQLQLSPATTGSALPPLPLANLEPIAGPGQRWQLRWDLDDPQAHRVLLRWLYGRPGAWPVRQAPPEWQTLLALLARLLRPVQPLGPGRRSLVPQQLDAGRCGSESRSHKWPASAN